MAITKHRLKTMLEIHTWIMRNRTTPLILDTHFSDKVISSFYKKIQIGTALRRRGILFTSKSGNRFLYPLSYLFLLPGHNRIDGSSYWCDGQGDPGTLNIHIRRDNTHLSQCLVELAEFARIKEGLRPAVAKRRARGR